MLELKAKEGCCEEAAPCGVDFYVPCNRPAAVVVQHIGRTEGPYRMCAACADHNVRHRNAKVIDTFPRARTAPESTSETPTPPSDNERHA